MNIELYELEIIDTGCNENLILKLNGKQIELKDVTEYSIIRNTADIILEIKKGNFNIERYLIDKVKASIDFTNETYRFLSRMKKSD